MMTLEQVRAALDGHNIARVSRETGIDYNYLYALVTGRRDNPSLKVFQKLVTWVEANTCECKKN